MSENEPQIDQKEILVNELGELSKKFGFEKDEVFVSIEREISAMWKESPEDLFSEKMQYKVSKYQFMGEKLVEKAIDEGKGDNPNLGKNIDYALFIYSNYKNGIEGLKEYCIDNFNDAYNNAYEEFQDETAEKINQIIKLIS